MRKMLAYVLTALLLAGMLSGCDEEETEPTQAAARPTAATAETTAPTEENTEPAEQPDEEEAAVSPLNTVVLRSEDPELKVEYVLLALNPEGPFLSEDITFNETGADALVHWLTAEQAQTALTAFGMEEYGEGVYEIPEEVSCFSGWIPSATENTQTIHLSVADSLAGSGVLDELLETFEENYGYTVEVQSTSATGTVTTAKLGLYDLVLTEASKSTEDFVADGYARVVDGFETEAVTLCTAEYLLCGPKDDPAGAADAENLKKAFSAIAKGEYIFLSRGEQSESYQLEQSLWPKGERADSWYLTVETEMGPLLVMNEFEGGYVLADKLTWLQFYCAEGII